MITDQQWAIFQKHIKPNATIRWGKWEGYLLETFPHKVELGRVAIEAEHAYFYGLDHFNDEGRLKVLGSDDLLHVQLCESPVEDKFHVGEIDYWYQGDFLSFEQIIALG